MGDPLNPLTPRVLMAVESRCRRTNRDWRFFNPSCRPHGFATLQVFQVRLFFLPTGYTGLTDRLVLGVAVIEIVTNGPGNDGMRESRGRPSIYCGGGGRRFTMMVSTHRITTSPSGPRPKSPSTRMKSREGEKNFTYSQKDSTNFLLYKLTQKKSKNKKGE